MNRQELIRRAIGRVEENACKLIAEAERFNTTDTAIWSARDRRTSLLSAARMYSNSINRLTRVRG